MIPSLSGKTLSAKGILSKDSFRVLFINDFCKYSLATPIAASLHTPINVSCVLSLDAIRNCALTSVVEIKSVASAVMT